MCVLEEIIRQMCVHHVLRMHEQI